MTEGSAPHRATESQNKVRLARRAAALRSNLIKRKGQEKTGQSQNGEASPPADGNPALTRVDIQTP